MNYSNSTLRLRPALHPTAPSASREPAGVLCIETDRRGTHWRVRKPATLARRTGSVALVAALVLTAPAMGAFVISDSPGLFTPSFRETVNLDAVNTTWFGWAPGTFDGTPDNGLLDFPAVTIGAGGLDGSLNDPGSTAIVSGSNNIYKPFPGPLTLELAVPTNGTPGTGFTTIIIQGRTLFGGYPDGLSSFSFPAVGGAAPDYVLGTNSSGQGQFWVKYEIPGNAPAYDIDFALVASQLSIASITVDTQWSATGYAADAATAVPEPSSAALLLGAALPLALRRRRVRGN
jgi:hypothetical protein